MGREKESKNVHVIYLSVTNFSVSLLILKNEYSKITYNFNVKYFFWNIILTVNEPIDFWLANRFYFAAFNEIYSASHTNTDWAPCWTDNQHENSWK